MSDDTKSPQSKADIKPDAAPLPPPAPGEEKPLPPPVFLSKKLDGYTLEYRGHSDTGWEARTLFDDGMTTDWGKCDGPPKDAQPVGKVAAKKADKP